MKIVIFIIFLILALKSCSSMKEAGQVLRNEKVKTTDEFLVKKKQPLILPPNYEKIPEPGSTGQKFDDKEKIKDFLKARWKNDSNKSAQLKVNNR